MTLPHLHGRAAYVFHEENFDVDQIVGVKNIRLTDEQEMLRVAMSAYDPAFSAHVKRGDLLIGAENFGYGHPHYPPMIAMRKLGIQAVIAESFSPGYWLGEIAEGFPQITCKGILTLVDRWDELEVDWETATIINHTKRQSINFEPLPKATMSLLASGGLIPHLQRSI